MTITMTNLSDQRRQAIKRAGAAYTTLLVDPGAGEPAQRQFDVVQDSHFIDAEAWDSVAALEDMVYVRGLAPHEIYQIHGTTAEAVADETCASGPERCRCCCRGDHHSAVASCVECVGGQHGQCGRSARGVR